MIRIIIPFMITVLFFMEPIFSLFSPITFEEELFTLVPRFVLVSLLFTAVYGRRKDAIIYGIVFGLLYDIFYIDIIGVYAFLYPMMCLLAVGVIRLIHDRIITVVILTLVLIGLLELLSYGFASLISITTIEFNVFVKGRLVPTIIANALFVIMFSWFFHKVIAEKVLKRLDEFM